MQMFNPPHPGEFILRTYLDPYGFSALHLAAQLNVAASTLNRVLKGESGISPEMALRLSKSLGRSAESWLAMQHRFDLSRARKTMKLGSVKRRRLREADLLTSAKNLTNLRVSSFT